MQNVKLCFIGAGFHATTNIFPAVVAAGAEIGAVATRNIENAASTLKQFGSGGTAYGDYHKMLAHEACDGVVVIAQPQDQLAIVLDCIAAGKNVYVEKPLGMNESDAKQAARAAEQARVVLMVGFMKRYAPIYTQLAALVNERTLGEVRSFQATFAVDSTPFCADDEAFLKLAAIHFVDLIRFLFGEVATVTGVANSRDNHISQSLSVQFENGIIGSIYFAGMTAWSRESEHITVTFDHGFAIAAEMNKLTVHPTLQQEQGQLPWQSLAEVDTVYTPSGTVMSGAYRDLYLRGYIGEIQHFMNCCKQGHSPSSSGRDNVHTMALCDQILSRLK
ncbi:Gfo/Idh/MocA family oxidoreductase [Hazenella sp. IB182353]|uniref:Gfo/Idh/MocA family protein n=1 Tax=Polycladospora coralii TaxID=2771432 RepID=UPI001745D508|nr:Gfo/Idh/MocA family oxidoreductase [Polycladospora coralii]MBS7531206.1 Gfo/Idh/MocA family oxidoreductase [Polycladospora coralii]